jgi:hypothetical protein
MANNGSHEKAHKGRRLRWWQLIVLVIVFSIGGLGLAYIRATGTIDLAYRVGTSLKAFRAILSLSSEDVRAFVDSYEIFGMEQISPRDESKIKDYYRVVNQLCALGEVEKMYIPPVLDLPKGVYGNQLLFEKMMAESLNVGPGKKLLELGCGRGRIAHHVARLTGAKVVGLNIGDDQIQNAIDYANSTGGPRRPSQMASLKQKCGVILCRSPEAARIPSGQLQRPAAVRGWVIRWILPRAGTHVR